MGPRERPIPRRRGRIFPQGVEYHGDHNLRRIRMTTMPWLMRHTPEQSVHMLERARLYLAQRQSPAPA